MGIYFLSRKHSPQELFIVLAVDSSL